eukprot:4408537-Amphidinium_carterae.1
MAQGGTHLECGGQMAGLAQSCTGRPSSRSSRTRGPSSKACGLPTKSGTNNPNKTGTLLNEQTLRKPIRAAKDNLVLTEILENALERLACKKQQALPLKNQRTKLVADQYGDCLLQNRNPPAGGTASSQTLSNSAFTGLSWILPGILRAPETKLLLVLLELFAPPPAATHAWQLGVPHVKYLDRRGA